MGKRDNISSKMLTFALFSLYFMDFHTQTDITPWEYRIHHSDKLLVMGSCFAEHIGERLAQMKFATIVNPYGVLYNPQSIAEGLTRLIEQRPFTEDELYKYPDGGWNTWLHHSRYSRPDKHTALNTINRHMEVAWQQISKADVLIITFGTSWVYRLKDTGSIVGNCHKEPERHFVREQLKIKDITNIYATLLQQINTVNPHLHILFTVSPVRHLKDGLHGNQLSKSVLLLAIDELCRTFPAQCHYFPAYEIVVDELRDYRFYAEDMAHPSKQAIDYVWELFVAHCIDPKAQQFMQKWEKIIRALEHRPFQADSAQYKLFVQQTVDKIQEFKSQHPYIDVDKEMSQCLQTTL